MGLMGLIAAGKSIKDDKSIKGGKSLIFGAPFAQIAIVAQIALIAFIALSLQGCFVQDFNKSARQSGYGINAGKSAHVAESSPERSSTKAESSPTKSSKQAKSPESSRLDSAPINPSSTDSAMLAALHKQQVLWSKTPYVSGGVKRSGADCSGFVQSVFSESFALRLPRTTIDQMNGGKKLGGKHIKHTKLRAGDLVFFKTGRGALGYHVGIYLEDSQFLHLSAKGGAKIASLNNSYWKPKLIKAVRYNMP